MLWLKESTYFARTGSGSFVLSYDALLRLDEMVASDVVDSVMPVLTDGRSFDEASALLPAAQQASARDLLGILQDHGLMVASSAAELHMSDRSVTVTGCGAMAAALAAALRQCGVNVRVSEPEHPDAKTLMVADGDSALRCDVAAHDDGVCWSIADDGVQTPVVPPAAALRRAASIGAGATPFDDTGTPVPPDTFTTIAAAQIARDVTRSRQVRRPGGVVTFLDRRTLRRSTHRVTVHPYDRPATQRARAEFRRDIAGLRNGPSLGRQELTGRWRRLCDERFGAFTDLDDGNFRQLPLKVTLARVSDPCSLLSEPQAVVGVGIDRESARERTILQALAAYGSIVVDPRRLVDQDGRFLSPPDGDGAQLLGSVRDGSVKAFVRAIDLADGRDRLLPVRQAFPALRTPQAFRAPCGTSAALNWGQAITHGLLQHCARLTVSGESVPPRPLSGLAAEDFDQDAGVRYLAAMAKAAGLDLTLHDLTGPAGVPVVACSLNSAQDVYGAGTHLAEAVREALTAALFHYQRAHDPALKAATSTATSAIWTSPAGSAALGPDRVLDWLTSLGYTPSVIVLDHDGPVHEALPYVLRVTLEQRVPAA